jgi:hypothetical protein
LADLHQLISKKNKMGDYYQLINRRNNVEDWTELTFEETRVEVTEREQNDCAGADNRRGLKRLAGFFWSTIKTRWRPRGSRSTG